MKYGNADIKLCKNVEVLINFHFSVPQLLTESIKKVTNKRYKKMLSISFFVINVVVLALVLFFQLKSDKGVYALDKLLSNVNYWFLFCAVVMFFVTVLVDSLKLSLFTHQITGKYMFGVSYKAFALSKYYELITPMGFGAQPYHVYYLNKNGVGVGNGITIANVKYISRKVIYMGLALFVILLNSTKLIFTNYSTSPNVALTQTLFWIGFIWNCILLVGVIFISVDRKVVKKICAWAIGVLYKLKIIKNPSRAYMKTLRTLTTYNKSTKAFFTTPKTAIVVLLLTVVSIFANFSIPFFIYCSFNAFNIDMLWITISMYIIVDLAMSVNPIPGGSGVAELSFTALFASLFASGVTFWALLFWRILTFYAYLLQGVCIFGYDYSKKIKRYNKMYKS